MPAHIQYNENEFQTANNFKVVLSEECYTRLLGLINLCGLHMGIDNIEYGTMLYGKVTQNQNGIYTFNFMVPSEFDDYEPIPQRTNLNTENMNEELIKNALLNGSTYNCIAHVHTHPYIDQTSRFLSEEDIQTYKNIFSNWESLSNQQEKAINTLGCLITISGRNMSKEDDISFVYYDSNTEQFYNIPNISVIINNREIPLEKINESFTYDDETVIHFNRTLLEKHQR